MMMKDDEIVALLPAARHGNRIVSHSGATFGGLIYSSAERATEVRSAFLACLHHYRRQGIETVLYKAVPHLFHQYPAEEDLHVLFLLNAALLRRDLSSVVVRATQPKLSKSRKYGIKRARRGGCEIRYDEGLKDFHDLLCIVLARHNASPVHSVEEMTSLSQRFPDNIRLVAAYADGKLLAGAWLFRFGPVLHTQYLACSEEGRKIGALDFLIANIIDHSPKEIEKISFGTSTTHQGREINEGLLFQKEGFGARSIVLDQYEIDLGELPTELL